MSKTDYDDFLNLCCHRKVPVQLGPYESVYYIMVENDPEEQQKRVRYTDIVANALMLQNVADLTDALEQLKQRAILFSQKMSPTCLLI